MGALMFNANEVFEAAKRIERNGAAFYAAAAALVSDESTEALLTELAKMEATHELIFELMQRGLAEQERDETPHEPDDDAYDFLEEMADKYVFNPQESPEAILRPRVDIAAVLEFAIQRERDSVIFYEGIKAVVPLKFGGARLDEIISQEMGHIVILSKQLRKRPNMR